MGSTCHSRKASCLDALFKQRPTGLEMHVAPLLEAHNNRALPLKKSRAIQGKKVKERATLPTILNKVRV